MIRKLRRKYISVFMLALFIVVTLLIGLLNIVNILEVNSQINNLLSIISDNGGYFPSFETMPRNRSLLYGDIYSIETEYATRYFVVDVDDGGNILWSDVTHIAALSEEDASSHAQTVLGFDRKSGFLGHYKFRVTDRGDEALLVFVDCSSQIQGVTSVLVQSVCVGLGVMAVMFILLLLLSKRATAPLVRDMEKQKEFITNAGHELKTPLAIIVANADAMELAMGKNKWGDNIRRQTMRLNKLMSSLLTLSKMGEEGFSSSFTDFSADQVLAETLAQYEEAAKLKQVEIRRKLTPDIPYHGDEEGVRQLCSVLLDNAVKYTGEGGCIEVSMSRRDKGFCLKISNTCKELPDEPPDRLFERFYRDDHSRTRKSGGYGIGLSIASAVAEAHGGAITASYSGENTVSFLVNM